MRITLTIDVPDDIPKARDLLDAIEKQCGVKPRLKRLKEESSPISAPPESPGNDKLDMPEEQENEVAEDESTPITQVRLRRRPIIAGETPAKARSDGGRYPILPGSIDDGRTDGPFALPGTRHQGRHLRVAKYLASRASAVSSRKIAVDLRLQNIEVGGSLQYLARHGLAQKMTENSHRWKATPELKARGVIAV